MIRNALKTKLKHLYTQVTYHNLNRNNISSNDDGNDNKNNQCSKFHQYHHKRNDNVLFI